MNRIYVLDTNVLVIDPDVLFKLSDCKIVIPMAVLGELDRFKRLSDAGNPRATAARKITRILDSLGSKEDISRGARTPSGSIVLIYRSHASFNGLANAADNKIVGTAIKLKKKGKAEIVVLSNDGNIRNAARAHGIIAMAYPFSTSSLHVADDWRLKCKPASPKMGQSSSVNSKQSWRGQRQYFVVLMLAVMFLVILVIGR